MVKNQGFSGIKNIQKGFNIMKKTPMGFAIFIFSVLSFASLVCLPGQAEASNTYYYILTWGSYGTGNGQFNFVPQYTPYNTVVGVVVDASGDVYVSDVGNNRIEKFDSNGNYLAQWGSTGTGNGQFNQPDGLAMDASGDVYVVDTGNSRIEKFDPNGAFLAKFGSYGAGNGQFNRPYSVALDASGDIYVVDSGNNRIEKFDPSGNYLTQWGSSGSGNGQFNVPSGIAVDASGNVYVTDTGNQRVEKFDSSGTYLTQWGFGVGYSVAVDGLGHVFVANYYGNSIQKFDSNGNLLGQFGTAGSGNGQLYWPTGVGLDSIGNVYVADTENNRMEKFSAGSTMTATFEYKDANGVVTPLANAYVYLQDGSKLPPMEKFYNAAKYILGPSDSNGYFSVDVPPGTYYVQIRQKAACHYTGCTSYTYEAPPIPGDYVWHSTNPPTVTFSYNQILNMGTIYAGIYGQPVTISGTVKGASGAPLAGWAVKAATVPCESGNWAYAHSFNECGSVKYPAWTDANGNYTITIKDPGTYYVYASPTLNFANTSYPGGYPTCQTAAGCEACGDYYYFNCPVSVTSSVTGENITVPGY